MFWSVPALKIYAVALALAASWLWGWVDKTIAVSNADRQARIEVHNQRDQQDRERNARIQAELAERARAHQADLDALQARIEEAGRARDTELADLEAKLRTTASTPGRCWTKEIAKELAR